MIPIFVTTSDHYIHALRPFAYLFNKYWSPQQAVHVYGFRPPDFPLPYNFYFHSIGTMADYPIHKWSDALLDILEREREPFTHFILMLEDYWLCRDVNVMSVRMLYDYARQFNNVLKIDLCADRLYAWGMEDYDACGYLDLVKSNPGSQYHMSLMAGIWNRELFKRFVIRGESPWDVELRGTPRVAAAGDDVLVLGTRQWPVKHILAYRNGDSKKLDMSGLRKVDIDYITEQGWAT